LERLGVPGVFLVAGGFEHDVETALMHSGMTMLRTVVLDGYYWYIPPEESAPIAHAHIDEIIDALLVPLTPEEANPEQLEKVDFPPVKITGKSYPAAVEEFHRIFDEYCWGDGLALLPPTREAVDWMLTGTRRCPDEVIGEIPAQYGKATIEKIAINAVMAGAKPEYLPVIIAAIEAVTGETYDDFDLVHPQSSLGGFQLAIWVSGPLAEELNMKSKDRIWTYGNRANGTIGRAIRLCLINLGHMWPGINDMARSRAYPYTYFTFGEDVSDSPWEPYHVVQGFDSEDSCVTVSTIGGRSLPTNYTGTAPYGEPGQYLTAEATIETIIDTVLAHRSGVMGSYNPLIASPRCHPPKYVFMVTPEMAADFKAMGYTQESLREYIFEATKIPYGELSADEIANINARIQQTIKGRGIMADQIHPDDLPVFLDAMENQKPVPILVAPTSLHFVVAGGAGKTVVGWSYYDHIYTWSSNQTRLIDVKAKFPKCPHHPRCKHW
jgi:hypothetical protein